MRAEGVQLTTDLTHLAVVGFVEVVKNLGNYYKTLRKIIRAIEAEKPRAVVLIDYPGFNLRLAAELKKRRIPVIYYISPQVWAWRKGRVKKIAQRVEKMICLFEFEVPLYEKEGLAVRWVGHPFLDVVQPERSPAEARRHFGLEEGVRTIGLLPGSRAQEIEHHLPILLASARLITKALGPCQFPVSFANGQDSKRLTKHLGSATKVRCIPVEGNFYDLVNCCDLVLMSSGSATLMTAILGTPMVVIYHVGGLTAWIARRFIRIPHIALANIVAGRAVVPELLQENATPDRIALTAQRLLENPERLQEMRKALRGVRNRLGERGAARRAAQEVLASIL